MLDCDTKNEQGKIVVACLKCVVCTKYKEVLKNRRNFSNNWIDGAKTMKTSSIRDHALSDQHIHAMALLNKEKAILCGESSTYSPTAQALSTLSEAEKKRLCHKFDIAYFVATEKLSFRKYPQICKLEARHGVNIGSTYNHDTNACTFVHYIAESQQ